MKYTLILVIAVAVFFESVIGLEFKDCGSEIGKFSHVEVSDCDTTKSVCILKRNSNATISISFELLETIEKCSKVDTVVHGIIMGIEMPFPLQNPNGCIESGISCPITSKSTYDYSATLPVLKQYPKVKVDVKWELKNEDNKAIVCVLIPAKIE